MPRGQGTGLGRMRDISDILQGQTLGGAFGMNTRKRNGGSFFDVEPNLLRPPTVKQSVPNFSEVPDISNILGRQIDPQMPGDAIMPGADIPSFGPGRMLGDFNDGSLLQIDSSVEQQASFDVPQTIGRPNITDLPAGMNLRRGPEIDPATGRPFVVPVTGGADDFRGITVRGEDSGTGVGPLGFGVGPSPDIDPIHPGVPQHIQDIIDDFPREMPQSVRDTIIKDLLGNATGTDSVDPNLLPGNNPIFSGIGSQAGSSPLLGTTPGTGDPARSDLENFQEALDFWRETGDWPDTGDQGVGDGTVDETELDIAKREAAQNGRPVMLPDGTLVFPDGTVRPPIGDTIPEDETRLPLELPEFTFSDAATPPPEYVSPDLKALPEFYGMEYDPYARAPTLTSVDDVVNMERPAGVSDEDWQGYKQNQFNARVGSAESKTFDQWKYGFGDVRGRAQDLQEPAIRSLERSVRRSLGGAIENPNVRRQTERATLGGFGMGLEDVSGAARVNALSEYSGDFRRAFETKERNYITALQQIGGENVATLQEAQINADRALKTYYQDEQRRYDVEYANWFAKGQEDIANYYAQIAEIEQSADTTTIIRTEDG